MKPFCCVTMPYGRKPDLNTGKTIDFDCIYQELIAPAITMADMEPVRLDMDNVGGVIHRAGYEMMVFSDFVVADLSMANPNVMYDLGVRHSFQPSGTVLICQANTRLPFNLQPFRVTTYSVDDLGRADRVDIDRRQLADVLRAAKTNVITSPVYQLLSGVQPPSLDRSTSNLFREQMAYNNSVVARITFAVLTGLAAVRDVEDEIRSKGELAPQIVVSLFSAYRALGGWEDMLRVSAVMPENLSRRREVQQKIAEALNELARPEEAAQKIAENQCDSGGYRVLGDIQRKRWIDADALEILRPRTFIRAAITAYMTAFDIDLRSVSPGVRALLLSEVANRPVAHPSLKQAVDYSVRVRIAMPDAACSDCVSAAVHAVFIGDQALASDALDRLPLTPTDLPAIRGGLEDIEIVRTSRSRAGGSLPVFVSEVENCLAEALKPKRAAPHEPGAAVKPQPAVGKDDTGASAMDNKKDFFISYTKADRDWATWIAWTLEEANYTVVIQAWDFQPGSDFVQNMDKALQETKRTILVLSEDFLKSAYTAAEWSAAFTKDPAGRSGLLVPVRVRECKPEGLLSSKVYVDLVSLSEDDARAVLLGAFSGRTRPTQAPQFPGKRVAPAPAAFPGEQTRGSRSEAIAAQIKRASAEERSVGRPTQVLSRLERLNLIKQLNELPAELFNMVVYAVNPPPGVVPPAPAAQGQRSSALLLWAEGPAGHGISEIQETLSDLLKS